MSELNAEQLVSIRARQRVLELTIDLENLRERVLRLEVKLAEAGKVIVETELED